MRILINDKVENKDRLIKLFENGGYERDNLIFVHSYEQCKIFIENQLIKNQVPLDLIITNNENGEGTNALKAQSLLFYKNSFDDSYSNGHFRINRIPLVLYSTADDKTELHGLGYDAIVKSNEAFVHDYFISAIDNIIKKWRGEVINDMENIGLNPNQYPYFRTKLASQSYLEKYGHNYLRTFVNHTRILSKEFISNPTFLDYPWLRKDNNSLLESQIEAFGLMFRYHVKYDRKNNERTILHEFFNKNIGLLKRGVFSSTAYELQLKEGNNERQICDYLLKTDIPEYVGTTFFEVKKEDVQLLAYKNRKHPKLSEDISKHLDQLDDYQLYTEKKEYAQELKAKIGYETANYRFQLLAGRLEEKEEFIDVFNSKLSRRYNGIEVFTFEEFEHLNYRYFEKISKLNPL